MALPGNRRKPGMVVRKRALTKARKGGRRSRINIQLHFMKRRGISQDERNRI